MSRIVLLARVQMALPPLKGSMNLFCLLRISSHLDIDAMFMFLIPLCVRQCMIAVRRAL